MKISLVYKHTTTVLTDSRNAQASPSSIHVVYRVMDATTGMPIETDIGRYETDQLSSYQPSDDEAAIVYQLQRLAETRYIIRSRPCPRSGRACFEAVKILTLHREIGEIEWEPPSPTFAAALVENAELEFAE